MIHVESDVWGKDGKERSRFISCSATVCDSCLIHVTI